MAERMRAGVAAVNITPSEPIWLAGWGGREKPSQGVSQEIYVKALAVQDEAGHTSVLLTSDLLGFSRTMADLIAARVHEEFGLERQDLILNGSHNHSGPVTGDVLHLYFDLPARELEVIARYTEALYDRISEAIGSAIEDLTPASLAFGQGLAGFAVNRRRSRPGGRPLAAVVDQDVPVFSVRSPEGELRGVVFGYACHATAIQDGKVNGDYPGYAQAALETMHPGVIALFATGCGADANPLPRFRPGLGESYGRILAEAVDEVLSGQMQPVAGPLRTAFAEAVLPFQKPPTREELQAMQPGREDIRKREVEHLLAILDRGEELPLSAGFPIHVWQFGSGLKLIALAGEPVADYATRFKREHGWDDVWVSGYNDDMLSYIPSLRILREGGYEGHTGMMEYGLPGPFAFPVEEIIAATVDELVQRTSGLPRPMPHPTKFQ